MDTRSRSPLEYNLVNARSRSLEDPRSAPCELEAPTHLGVFHTTGEKPVRGTAPQNATIHITVIEKMEREI